MLYSCLRKLVKRIIKRHNARQLAWLQELWKRNPTENAYEIEQLWFVEIAVPNKTRDHLYEIVEFESGTSLQFQKRTKYHGECRFGFERARDDPRLVYIKIVDRDQPETERRHLMVERIVKEGPPPTDELRITEGRYTEDE